MCHKDIVSFITYNTQYIKLLCPKQYYSWEKNDQFRRRSIGVLACRNCFGGKWLWWRNRRQVHVVSRKMFGTGKEKGLRQGGKED